VPERQTFCTLAAPGPTFLSWDAVASLKDLGRPAASGTGPRFIGPPARAGPSADATPAASLV